MQLIDTHCHIHEAGAEPSPDNPTQALWQRAGQPDPNELIRRAAAQQVTGMICVGTTAADSEQAVQFAEQHPACWASIGIHPHEAKEAAGSISRLAALLANRGPTAARQPGVTQRGASPKKILVPQNFFGDTLRQDPRSAQQSAKIVAIGECGLDYFYNHSPKATQTQTLKAQIELALQHDLPLIFHVREAFTDFWPIFDHYKNLRGVLHSYTDNQANLREALKRGLYIGLNGIMTFTKHSWQHDVAKNIPLQKLLLETDAPFLTPEPHRGKVNEPSHIRTIAEFLAKLRGETLGELAAATTQNARELFRL